MFVYLPWADRKSVKLVCKQWYDASNTGSFLGCQKFVCSGLYPTSSILRTLSNCKCKYFNVEFNAVDFRNDDMPSWKNIGPKIRALYFVDCTLGSQQMCDVIVNCTEMTHLSIDFSNIRTGLMDSLGLLEDLFKREIRRRKLTSLDIRVNSTECGLTNAILSHLFLIYPNISQIGFTHHALDPTVRMTANLWSKSMLTFSPVLYYISSRPNMMTKLDLHTTGSRTAFAWQMVVSSMPFKRLVCPSRGLSSDEPT